MQAQKRAASCPLILFFPKTVQQFFRENEISSKNTKIFQSAAKKTTKNNKFHPNPSTVLEALLPAVCHDDIANQSYRSLSVHGNFFHKSNHCFLFFPVHSGGLDEFNCVILHKLSPGLLRFARWTLPVFTYDNLRAAFEISLWSIRRT